MSQLTKTQWQNSQSTGFGDKNHPINHAVKHVHPLKSSMKENAEMALSDLTKIIKYSQDLQSMFSVNDNLEDWVKAKLNHACDYVATVRDYLKFYQSEKELGSDDKSINEKWSIHYKNSINCDNPKGFSQQAHCRARKLRQSGHATKSKPVKELYKEVMKDLIEEINSSMAMGALKQLNSDAQELQSMLKPETQLEDWVKYKLNLAGEYLDDVYHHLDQFGPDGRELDESYYAEKEKRSRDRMMRFGGISSTKKYWITPDGEFADAGASHEHWIGDKDPSVRGATVTQTYDNAIKKGYVRVILEPSVGAITLSNLKNDNFALEGNSIEGVPPINQKIKDAIKNFVKEHNLRFVYNGRGDYLKSFNSDLEEGFKDIALAAALAAGTFLPGTKAVAGEPVKQAAVASKKMFVDPDKINTSSSMEKYVLKHEGAVRNLYYIGGKPHIGVGHHLDGSSESREHIKQIVGMNKKNPDMDIMMKKYVNGGDAKSSFTTVILTDDQISKLFELDFEGKKNKVSKMYRNFNNFPTTIQTALIDSFYRGEKHPATDREINKPQPDWNKVADLYLDDNEYRSGGGVAKRMGDNAALFKRGTDTSLAQKENIQEGFYSGSKNYWISPSGKMIDIDKEKFPLSDHATWAVVNVLADADPEYANAKGKDVNWVYQNYSGQTSVYTAMVGYGYVRCVVMTTQREVALDFADHTNEWRKYLSKSQASTVIKYAINKEYKVIVDMTNAVLYAPPTED
jgi:hypothetical protein